MLEPQIDLSVMRDKETSMRRLALAIALAGATSTAHAATIEPPQDRLHLKVLEESGDGQWHGHQHWLYDEDNQPETDAKASKPSDCTQYRIRVPRASGVGTEIKRIEKCK
jgi:hypothetical protein